MTDVNRPRFIDTGDTARVITRMLDSLAAAAIVALATLGAALPAQAQQQNIEKLKQMKVSGTDPTIPTVPQTGKNADQLCENLRRVKLPPGFKIDLYAVGARCALDRGGADFYVSGATVVRRAR